MAKTTTVPEKYLPLLTEKKALAHIATVMADGSPQVTPVWFTYRDGRLVVNTVRGHVKDRNMQREPRVAVSIVDPENAYSRISFRGRVVKRTEGPEADACIDAFAKKYMGVDKYPRRSAGEKRVMYEIEVTSVAVMG